MKNTKTSQVVKGGMFTALSIMFLYLAAVLPSNKLFFAGAASTIIPISILTIRISYSFLVYAAVSILGLFLPGPKFVVISYIVFFGLYGFIKYYIERLRKLPIEIILKMIFFNISLICAILVYKSLFIYIPEFNTPVKLIYAAIQPVFLIYDYALTLFIAFAEKKFLKNT